MTPHLLCLELLAPAGRADTSDLDAAVVARLSRLPEGLVLSWFWGLISQHADRLWILRHAGAVDIERPPTWDPAEVRREHEQMAPTGDRTQCFACRSADRRLYRHHVIEVHRGGSNSPRNQVNICFRCHKCLHPWLRDTIEQPAPTTGFESLRQLTDRTIRMHDNTTDEAPA